MKKGISFRTKMLLAFSALIIFCIGGVWLVFSVFIDRVTINRKIRDLEKVYETIDDFFGESRDFYGRNAARKINDAIGQQYFVFLYNASPQVRFVSGSDFGEMNAWYIRDGQVYSGSKKNKAGDPELLAEHERYRIYRFAVESSPLGEDGGESGGKLYYLDAYGKLRNGFTIHIRTDIGALERGNDAVIRLLLVISFFAFLLAGVIAWLFSRRMMKPVVQLSEHAERMARMDFSARCDVDSNDAIGVLADSLNRLSWRLQETLGELKTANSELQSDLEHHEAVDAMRSDFIANVSHELKTPIALIQGYAEGLSDNVNDNPEDRAYYCNVIIDEAAKMNRMVQKLMTLNQLEFGGNQVEYERFDIVGMLTGLLNSTEVLRNQKGITLHYHEDEPVYVWADQYMIEEVATNYISNAINHASKSKEIAVSLEKGDRLVRVSVYNTGECIPEEELDRIWIKFYKVDKARSREYGGSGIGLSIVKAVMERHHCSYGAINHQNGVEFWFELELANMTEDQ
ncbi:MAG: HAMP domain-containing protein [Lachnospiraceae bacterium]|nr:HAMP domain-containing protein [Lachnospiraceae bacterium]